MILPMTMDNQMLVQELIDAGVLKTPRIIDAFRHIKREDFVTPHDRADAYIDAPLPIGYGGTISQPTTVAIMLELLQPRLGEKVLDIGSGSGWAAALLASSVGENGRVIGIELIPELVRLAQNNIKRTSFTNITIRQGNGYDGAPDRAPFAIIHVAAAADHVPPKLLAQLADNGRMVVPVGEPTQDLFLLTKHNGRVTERRYTGFQFVPLVQ